MLQSILQRCLAVSRSNMPTLATFYKIMPSNSLSLGWVKCVQHLDRHIKVVRGVAIIAMTSYLAW